MNYSKRVMTMDSLKATDEAAAAVAVAPRVTLGMIEGAVKERYHFTGAEAATNVRLSNRMPPIEPDHPLQILSICLLVMDNGFTVIGKSAPASPANFDPELGHRFAYEDAIRQLWPLMGYALRDRLTNDADRDRLLATLPPAASVQVPPHG